VDISKLVVVVNMRTIIYGLTVLFLFLMQFEIEMNGKIPESNRLYLKLNYRRLGCSQLFLLMLLPVVEIAFLLIFSVFDCP